MKNIVSKSAFYLLAFFIFTNVSNFSASAQTARPVPELTVSGFRLGGDEEAAKQLLQNYSPRFENESSQPKYMFYNEYGNQVMTVTAYSKERPFLIVAIEVFAVGKSYQNRHYQLKDKSYFETESPFFLGTRPSATSMLFGAANMTGPKEIIKKKGAPDKDESDGKTRILRYRFDNANLGETQKIKLQETSAKSSPAGNNAQPVFTSYNAEYRFVKNELRRFMLSIQTADSAATAF
ncbi:MAG: hypothetical protein JWN60_1441 [Acidobacteria bacterium]|jgi:hypothetical protein|nr:hypothetical protein [Acidobacteriota bacterium]